jgi:hypothetical protein
LLFQRPSSRISAAESIMELGLQRLDLKVVLRSVVVDFENVRYVNESLHCYVSPTIVFQQLFLVR